MRGRRWLGIAATLTGHFLWRRVQVFDFCVAREGKVWGFGNLTPRLSRSLFGTQNWLRVRCSGAAISQIIILSVRI